MRRESTIMSKLRFNRLHGAFQATWVRVQLRHPVLNRPSLPRPNIMASAGQALTSGSPSNNKQAAVIAFGGNALLRRGEDLTMENQRRNAAGAAAAVAELLRTGQDLQLCLTHGNGPQVGLLAQSHPESGLDVLDAESEGQIGYLLELEVANALQGRQDVVTLLTQTVVDPEDPAFHHPTKPIGRWYDEAEAKRLEGEKGWAVAKDGDRWRRVVASPQPLDIVESRAVKILLDAGVVVICCGGGGIPVAIDAHGGKKVGVEAVVDKDAASALLAEQLGAQWLVMLTDADAIYDPGKWPDEKVPIPSPVKCSEAEQREFASGSMGPKVLAACSFVKRTGGKAAVGNIADLAKILREEGGTVIVPG